MAYILTDNYKDLKADVDKALDVATGRIKSMLDRYSSGDVYPTAYKDGFYEPVPNSDVRTSYWTSGFWTGCLWLAYEATGDKAFRELAEKNVDDFYKRAYENDNIDWHHDTGFLYIPSCVSAYKLTGNETAKKAALIAAYSLARRFRYKGEFIQSMSDIFDDQYYKFIVDTMLNIPLLFWASDEIGEPTYREKAEKHIKTTLKYAMREDGTTYHHVLMDKETGTIKEGQTLQGASANSCWSRGQAWVVYGLALAYGYTKDESILEPFVKVTDYFMDHLPEDSIPFWDFDFTDGDDEPRDSSAAAIAACGIMEMAQHLPPEKCNMKKYLDKTADMMHSMINKYAEKEVDGTEGLLNYCIGSKPHGSVSGCLSFGDYYYLEALIRATRDWKKYW